MHMWKTCYEFDYVYISGIIDHTGYIQYNPTLQYLTFLLIKHEGISSV